MLLLYICKSTHKKIYSSIFVAIVFKKKSMIYLVLHENILQFSLVATSIFSSANSILLVLEQGRIIPNTFMHRNGFYLKDRLVFPSKID